MPSAKKNPTLSRRSFLTSVAAGAAVLAVGGLAAPAPAAETIALPPLPYPPNALEPYISAKTLGFHHGKHHAAYVANTQAMIKGGDLAGLGLKDVILKARHDPSKAALFNNAAQVFNHDFYWPSMKPGGGGAPTGDLAARIKTDFGSLDALKAELSKAALGQFGSGWAWLALRDGKLAVLKTSNAETPLTEGLKPLLTIDVWEHAYYLDYQNRRGDYVKAWLDHLVNWEFAAQNLKM